jgi:hypothetical protein
VRVYFSAVVLRGLTLVFWVGMRFHLRGRSLRGLVTVVLKRKC